MGSRLATRASAVRDAGWLAVAGWVGLAVIAVLSVAPFFLDPQPTKFAPRKVGAAAWLSKGSLVLVMGLAIGLRTWADRRRESRAILLNLLFLALAASFVAYHWYHVDQGFFVVEEGFGKVRYHHVDWQRALYYAVLNHKPETHGEVWVPHIYRPLPYGFTRALELWVGNWTLACLAYRLFFEYWLIWGCFRFVRLFRPLVPALLTCLVLALLYPFSVRYYMGQLTDPMSHAFFVLAMIALVQGRWLWLGALLALGIGAKETAVVLVPVYALDCWRQGRPAWGKSAVLGMIAGAAFLGVRLPLGWATDPHGLNGSQLMIAQNLGLGDPNFPRSAPFYQNYVQPMLFIGIFLPLIERRWRGADKRLQTLFLTLTTLVLLSSVGFSWLYESRNYVPLLPVLTALGFGRGPARADPDQVGSS